MAYIASKNIRVCMHTIFVLNGVHKNYRVIFYLTRLHVDAARRVSCYFGPGGEIIITFCRSMCPFGRIYCRLLTVVKK